LKYREEVWFWTLSVQLVGQYIYIAWKSDLCGNLRGTESRRGAGE